MTRPPTPLPASLGGTAFSVARARRAGVRRGRLRADDLATPFHGVRAPERPADPEARRP